MDFDSGDSSVGELLIRNDGESNDCDRMRTLGEGVRGSAMSGAMTGQ